MKTIEGFAGSCSFSFIAEERGHKTFTIDIVKYPCIDLVADMEFVSVKDIPFVCDVGLFSIPCTSYSIAAISHHRNMDYSPKTEFAKKSDRLCLNTIKLIKDILKINPNFIWYIENPRGVLRKMPFMKQFHRTTVTYCSYGDKRMKPTDIWSNNIFNILEQDKTWHPRPMCHNGNTKCHHEPAPRGSRTGTQGLKNNYERSKIPRELCEEIIIASEVRYDLPQM